MKQFLTLVKTAFLAILMVSVVHGEPQIFDLAGRGLEQYQDIYANGEIVLKSTGGDKHSDKRFQVVDSILKKYNRPFTMLDVGASQGYFTFRAAEKYPESVFVMLEGTNRYYPLISDQLASICELNSSLSNVIWLDKKINVKDFKRWSVCEHVDVVLLLNILHWFPNDWQRLLDSICSMSHVVILEVPPIEGNNSSESIRTRRALHEFLSKKASNVIPGVPRHTDSSLTTTFYVLEQKNPHTLDTTTLLHPNYGDRVSTVHFDYDSKILRKKALKPPYVDYEQSWQPGINLITFLAFHGGSPKRNDLAQAIPVDTGHFDWMPNNMVIQGGNIIMIDKDDPKNGDQGSFKIAYSPEKHKEIVTLILEENQRELIKKLKRFYSTLNIDWLDATL